MFLFYLGTILSYLLYQAAVGGLFFILAKGINDPLFSSAFLMVEPIFMLLFGIKIAKYMDEFRKRFSSYLYIVLSSVTLFFFFCLYLMRGISPFVTLLFYSIFVAAFMIERIYRQRLPRDFANSTKINQRRINAIANLANRGAPILSPWVLYFFPIGLDEKYLFIFIILSLLATMSFCTLTHRLTLSSQKAEQQKVHALYQAENLGIWHVWHLFLMNLVLGGLFMVLSQSVLSSTKIIPFLQGPSLYFAGFWVTMVWLILFPPHKKIVRPLEGLYFVAAVGIFLMASSVDGIVSIFALGLAGLCYGFAINHLGTFIQNQLDHTRYSYYETRAQTGGRIAVLIALAATGAALNWGLTTDFLRGVMGVGALMSAGLLACIFYRVGNRT